VKSEETLPTETNRTSSAISQRDLLDVAPVGAEGEFGEDELLPVPYFHIVFTLPHELSALTLQNKRLLYDLLFRTGAATMLELARDPRHLGADVGFLGVLHTWGQNLQHHPHVHYIVPAGGLAPDGSRWIDSSRRFFLPVKALMLLRRGSPDRNLTLIGTQMPGASNYFRLL
jgi:hypothetical protein